MKKIYVSILSLLGVVALIAQPTPTSTQGTFICKETATWCGPCGAWGRTLHSEIYNDNHDKGLVVELHVSSSELANPTQTALVDNFPPASGVPNWYAQGKNITCVSSTGGIFTSMTRDSARNVSNRNFDMMPQVASSLDYSLSGTSLSVKVKSKFFENVSGDYYMAVYLIEDSVSHRQNGTSGTGGYSVIKHKSFIRTSLHGTNHFGEMITTGGAATAGSMVNGTYDYVIPATYIPATSYLGIVLWKKNGSKYDVVNVYKMSGYLREKSFEPNVGIADLNANTSVEVFPTVAKNQVTLSIDATVDATVSYQVVNVQGKIVSTNNQVAVVAGKNAFEINTTNLSKGTYYVQVSDSRNIVSPAFIVE